MNIEEIQNLPTNNETIINSLIMCYSCINNPKYNKICCSVSGGSDSDIIMDMCYKVDINHKVDYVFFNTGIEYKATKEHLKYLENKYNVEIKICKPKKTIPLSCKENGIPFISKNVSEQISRLQNYNFDFVNNYDKSYDELVLLYPKCTSALKWYTNSYSQKIYNIDYNKGLKQFLKETPPTFAISNKCCDYAKKDVFKYIQKQYGYDLSIIGVRKAEGGVRSIAYDGCIDVYDNENGYDKYRPIFFYTNNDKEEYEKMFDIQHSMCYNVYGMKRTGCAGCPYNIDWEKESKIIQEYEPNLYKAINVIFGQSYEYTKQYRHLWNKIKGKEIEELIKLRKLKKEQKQNE